MLLLSGCENEIKKPTEDTLLAKEAIAAVEGMRDAYLRRAFRDFRKFCTEGGYKSATRGIPTFKRVELDFTPRWVEIDEEGTIFINVSWNGQWDMGDKTRPANGMAVFKLTGRPLKVDSIERGSPFAPFGDEVQ